MAFVLRRPFIYMIVAIVAVVLIIAYLAGTHSPVASSVAFTQDTALNINAITMGQYANLTIGIANSATPKSVGLHIIYYSTQLVFYEIVNNTITSLPDPLYNSTSKTYTITYPKPRMMNTGDAWSILISVKGLDPGAQSYKYTIDLEVWAGNELSQRKPIQLTVSRS